MITNNNLHNIQSKPKIDNKKIRNIIFDFGGVIINIDYSAIVKSFRKLGIKNFDTIYSQSKQIPLFDDFEKGFISSYEFRNQIRKITHLNVADKVIDKAWNSIILDIPDKRVKLLENIKNNYRTFMLSNTNEIHYNVYTDNFKKKYGYKNFSELFEKAYFSFKLGMKKPHKEIFEYVLYQNNLIPEETLFIDDSAQNFDEAKKIGIQTYYIKKEEDITDIFIDNKLSIGIR